MTGARPTPILFRSRIQGAVLDLLRMHTILPILASWMFKIEHSNKQGDSSSGQFIKGLDIYDTGLMSCRDRAINEV